MSKGVINFKAVDAFGLGVSALCSTVPASGNKSIAHLPSLTVAHDVAHIGTAPHDAAALKAAGADTLRHVSTGASMTDAERAVMRVLIERAMGDFTPTVAPRVPAPLARLTLRLMAVEPDMRPSAEAARVALSDMTAESLMWSNDGSTIAEMGEGTPSISRDGQGI